jgi:hypothetical protein
MQIRRVWVWFLLAVLCACSRQEPAAPKVAPTPPAVAPEPVRLPPPTLGRAQILAAIAEAASAAATGAPAGEEVARLAGRRFVLRLPFGCAGTSAGEASGWSYDPGTQALKLSVRPEAWTDAPWARQLFAGPKVEAIEGFWVKRPWIMTEACPAAMPPNAAPSAATPESVGLAQVFEAGDSRLQRRNGQAYSVTEKAGPDELPGASGFRLVLEGRVAASSAGPPVRCHSADPGQRPLCLLQIDLEKVAIEDARGRRFGEWTE